MYWRAYTRPIPVSVESRRGCFWFLVRRILDGSRQGGSGQGSKLVRLTTEFVVDNSDNCFY